MKKFTAKDVFEQIDLLDRPHGGQFLFDSPFIIYGWPGYEKGMELLESIAESLSMDGTVVE